MPGQHQSDLAAAILGSPRTEMGPTDAVQASPQGKGCCGCIMAQSASDEEPRPRPSFYTTPGPRGWRLEPGSELNVFNAHFLGGASGKEPTCQCRRQETRVASLGREDSLEEDVVTHPSILAWRRPMDRGACRATVHRVAESEVTEHRHPQCLLRLPCPQKLNIPR